MIVHTISPYKIPHQSYQSHPPQGGSKKWKGKAGTTDHLSAVFERAKAQCRFEIGQVVTHRGRASQIIDILDEIDKIEWNGFRPRFIELYCENDNRGTFLVHPKEIRRKR